MFHFINSLMYERVFGGSPSASPRHRPLTLEQNACSRPQGMRSAPAGCGTRQLPNRT